LEMLSDGAFAIIITLLVLEIHRPNAAQGALAKDLVAEWPSYVAYAVAFIYVGIIWLNHHYLFERLRPFFVTDEARWQALVHKDERADGLFWFSVKTTGVYCRPSCPARLPNRENVAFHLSPKDAEKAGFRACKRCDPSGPGLSGQHAEAVARASLRPSTMPVVWLGVPARVARRPTTRAWM
jgi:hypothetical protein